MTRAPRRAAMVRVASLEWASTTTSSSQKSSAFRQASIRSASLSVMMQALSLGASTREVSLLPGSGGWHDPSEHALFLEAGHQLIELFLEIYGRVRRQRQTCGGIDARLGAIGPGDSWTHDGKLQPHRVPVEVYEPHLVGIHLLDLRPVHVRHIHNRLVAHGTFPQAGNQRPLA